MLNYIYLFEVLGAAPRHNSLLAILAQAEALAELREHVVQELTGGRGSSERLYV